MLYVTINIEYNRLVALYLARGHDIMTARSYATLQLLEIYS